MIRLLGIICAVVIGAIALPFAIVGGLFFSTRKCTPQELAAELNALAADDMRWWDGLECGGRIQDPRLEAIRQEAMAVELPFRDQDRALLTRLAAKAAAITPQ